LTNSHRGVVRGLRFAACLFAAGLVVAACSSGPPTAGKLNVSSTHVKTAQPPDPATEAKSGDSVTPGQVLSTDSTGLAQVSYPDGSLTRLDSDTIFKVVALTANSGSRQTLGSVSGGKVWNKVSKLSRSGSFEVEAGGTTAAVRGTSFAVECTSGSDCNIISVIHTVVVTSTQTGQSATLPPTFEVNASNGVLGSTVQLTAAQLAADSWIESNLRKDGDKPFTAPPAPPPPPAPTPPPAALPFTPPPAPAVVQNCYVTCAPPNVVGNSIPPNDGGVASTAASTGGTTGSSGTGSTATSSSGIAGLPFTGADIVELLVVALILIAGGWLLLIRPRKRSGDQQAP
jgi:FecR protein